MSERDVSAQPFKQSRVVLCFKLLDVFGYGWLADEQFLGCFGVA